MATLDLSTVNAQSDPEDKWIQPGAKGVPDRSGPAPRKTGLARNLIKREKRKESPAIESGRFQGADLPKRTLFTPPSVNIPAAGIAAAPADMAPRAAMGGSSVETSEGSDRKATAHQTGVPSQESIEDMAREVLTELKRRWSYELERRGIE
jgi:hypothetical protein